MFRIYTVLLSFLALTAFRMPIEAAEIAEEITAASESVLLSLTPDTDLAHSGCQGDSVITGIRSGDKIGFALYLDGLMTLKTAAVEFSWNDRLAVCHRNLTGSSIPGDRFDLNGIRGLSLPAERSIFDNGGRIVSVVDTNEPGRYLLTLVNPRIDQPSAQDSLLCLAVFRTTAEFSQSDTLTITTTVSVEASDGTSTTLPPRTVTVEPERPRLTLTFPEDGAKLTAGVNYDIAWEHAGNDTTTVTLEYSLDDGETWAEIGAGIDASAFLYRWLAPETTADGWRVRISDSSGTYGDERGGIVIRQGPTVQISVLDEGRTSRIPVKYAIETPGDGAVSLHVQYSPNNGASWRRATIDRRLASLYPDRHEGLFFWEARRDIEGLTGTVILKITPSAGIISEAETAEVFIDYNNRPELAIDPIDDIVTGNVGLRYTVSDDENDIVDIGITFSSDGGLTWRDAVLTKELTGIGAEAYTGEAVWISTADFPGALYTNVQLRLAVSDAAEGKPVVTGPLAVDNRQKPSKGSISKDNTGYIPVLGLHNINVNTVDNSRFSLTPDMFERFVTELKHAGYRFLSSDEYVDYIVDGGAVPKRSILLSFDDGYKGFYTRLFPILKEYSVHAGVNLITSRINISNYLTTDDIREMYDTGLVDFQSHSWMLHDYKLGQPMILQFNFETDVRYRNRLKTDMEASKIHIEQITGQEPTVFVTPFGLGNETMEEVARESGFKAVFYIGSHSDHTYGDNPLHIERINVYRYNVKVLGKLLISGHFTGRSGDTSGEIAYTQKAASSDVGLVFARNVPGGIISSSPAIDEDGTLYIGSWDSCLYAFESDGSMRWKFRTEEGISSSPSIGPDGTIYVGSYDRHLYAVQPDGSMKWKYDGWDALFSSPAIGPDGTVYIGSTDGGVIAVNSDGSSKWNYRTGDSVFSSPSIGPDGTVYVGSWNNGLFAFHPDGTLKWDFSTGKGIESSPAIGADGTVYVGCMNKFLYAVNPDGTLKWKYRTLGWIDSSPVIGRDGTIYFGCSDGRLYALYPEGSVRWKFETGSFISGTPAIGTDGTLYVGSWDGFFYAVNPDGTLAWRFQTSGGIDTSPNLSPDGIIYVGSNDSWLYGFDTGSGAGLADSPWPRFRGNITGTGSSPETFHAMKRALRETAESAEDTPSAFYISDPYPNPFNPVTTLEYSLPYSSRVTATLYNSAGQLVRVIEDGRQNRGIHTLSVDASELPSGLYFVRVTAAGRTATKKVLLLK